MSNELRIEHAYVYGPDTKVYLAEQVDKAIAELKDKIKFCSDFELAARKDIEEMRGQHQMLKQFGHYKLSPVPGHMINHEMRQYVSYNVACMIINHLESESKELKQKLEDVQASHYAEMVDAGMRERRLRRALWLDRAARAHAEWGHWATIWFCDTKAVLNINKSSVSQDPYHCTITRNAAEWRNLWAEVERKCRAKAEEYK